MLALGASYVLGLETWLLVGWEVVALGYLFWGRLRVWSGERLPTSPSAARVLRQWAWISPVLSSAV